MLLLKADNYFWKNCPKLKKKQENDIESGIKVQRLTHRECPTCGKTNNPAEKSSKGAGAFLRPKRKQSVDKYNDASGEEETSKRTNIDTTYAGSLIQKTDFATTQDM